MIVVIIAGGSGTRLWPLSTPGHPKHLLTIDGDKLSLLQNTYERAKRLADKIYIVSEAGHIHHVKQQLPELSESAFVVETARRGTANCILASLVQISKDNPQDEPVIFMHADHYIRDTAGFIHSCKLAVKTSQKYGQMVLIGIEPHYASTGFGYIKKGDLLDDASLVFRVDGFKEKPDRETARSYMNSGNYLWNAGYFVGSVEVFKQAMQTYAPEMFDNYQRLLQAAADSFDNLYTSLESISIDYALIEKVENLLVVPASFDWMDLGSFSDLHKAVGGDEKGNHVHGRVETENVQNSFVHNQEDKPVAVIGLDNVAIINTPHGILITRKDLSQKVGDVSKRLGEQ
jgi:mannose-1-phosphate guanylyltransferase/mannose-6-phosphate isomerase